MKTHFFKKLKVFLFSEFNKIPTSSKAFEDFASNTTKELNSLLKHYNTILKPKKSIFFI